MSRHLMSFESSGAVQTALNEEVLGNPYVAALPNGLDYNSLEPIVPTLGVWSDDGNGTYTFQVTETDTSYWDTNINIGTMLGIYEEGNQKNAAVVLSYNIDSWHMEVETEGASDPQAYDFVGEDGWTIDSIVTDEGDSSGVRVEYDGQYTFVFQAGTGSHVPLNMTTINPPYPA